MAEIQKSHWGAALPAAQRGDFVYVYGYIHRALTSLNEVLFAAERQYLLNEKSSVKIASAFSVAPPNYDKRVAEAFGLLTIQSKDMVATIEAFRILREDVMGLVSGR